MVKGDLDWIVMKSLDKDRSADTLLRTILRKTSRAFSKINRCSPARRQLFIDFGRSLPGTDLRWPPPPLC